MTMIFSNYFQNCPAPCWVAALKGMNSIEWRGYHGKQITFMRHGTSCGNAGLMGAIESMSLQAYKDGRLTKKGEQDLLEKVASLERKTLMRLASTELVLVSPLSRCLGSCLVVLAAVRHRAEQLGIMIAAWPNVEVVAELREKVKSDSERPGSGEDPLEYIREIGQRYGKYFWQDSSKMQELVQSLSASYSSERFRTRSWFDEPDNALKMMDMIRTFRQKLDSLPEDNILLIGHSGWSRFAFSAFLPQAGSKHSFNQLDCVTFGERKILPLANASIVTATFKDGRFRSVSVNVDGCKEDRQEVNLGLFTSVTEAVFMGLLPCGTKIDRIFGELEARLTGNWNKRLFTFSSLHRVSRIAWSEVWGGGIKSLIIRKHGTNLACLSNNTAVLSCSDDSHRPYKIRMTSDEDMERFCAFFDIFRGLSED